MARRFRCRHFTSLLLLVAIFLGALASIATPVVIASNNPGIPIYLHHLPGNVTVSGIQTSQILNTTTLWDGAAEGPNLRYNVFNFTLYPALTSSMTSIGPGSISLWVTVSGAPGTLNATIYDSSAGGQLAVVTSSALITLNSSPTVPYKITMGFNINHTFSQSSTVKLSLTVFKVSQLYVWYDSALYPSALVIPVSNIPTVTQVESFDANFTARTSFSLNWTASNRIVFLVVHVADPFGAYHVANATVTIADPSAKTVFSGVGSSLTTNPAAPSKLFAVSWPYSASLANGTYTVSATGNDTASDQATGTVTVLLTSVSGASSPPPTNPPPNGGWPTLYWLIASGLIAALIAALLAFLFLTKRRRLHCSKCHAIVESGLGKCPYCGNPLGQRMGTTEQAPNSKESDSAPSNEKIGRPTASPPHAHSPPVPDASPKDLNSNDQTMKSTETKK